jgi:hypothetical protein
MGTQAAEDRDRGSLACPYLVEFIKYRGRDSNPHGLSANGFSYHHGFRRPPSGTVCGLDYTFAFYYARSVTVRREPSSLYTFLEAV